MIPKPPQKEGQLGFLYLPPYRVQGISVAGEQSVIHVPELDVAFDIGLCPRAVLPAPTVALSHSHMDHIAGLPYYFSQRFFQKLGMGRCICPAPMADPLRAMMRSWVDLERQETPFEVVGARPGDEFELKPNIVLRALDASHGIPALGFAVIERRQKLREDLVGQPQDRIRELRMRGEPVTRSVDIPLVAYTGDTEPGPHLLCDEIRHAKIVVTECTFFDSDHRDRARIGRHLHVEDLRSLIEAWDAEHVVVTHISRRTMLSFARQRLDEVAGEKAGRVHMLMDHRTNRMRLEHQAEQEAAAANADSDPAVASISPPDADTQA